MPTEPRPGSPLVVMGVSGCGKSTIGMRLAARLGVPFMDADDLHPGSNIAKMRSGIALVDADRWPWLDVAGEWLVANPTGVLSCSALRRSFRDRLRSHCAPAFFVHLDGDRALIAVRQAGRTDHFMPSSLLASQFADLEPLESDEAGLTVDIGAESEVVVADLSRRLLR